MIWAWIVTIVMAMIYMANAGSKSREEWAKIAFVLVVATIWMLYFNMSMDKSFNPSPSIWNLAYIPIFLLVIWFIKTEKKKTDIEPVARLQSYWPVTEKQIRQRYADRLIEKKDRIEVEGNVDLKFWRIVGGDRKIISGNVWQDVGRFDTARLTRIAKPNEVRRWRLYSTIFTRITEIVEFKEIDVDYGEILADNGGYAEFFLMDLWRRYTQDVNIGTANLEILATRPIEYKLIGALDAVDMQCVKRHGLDLYIAWMKHHGRIDATSEDADTQPEEESEEWNGEDEDL